MPQPLTLLLCMFYSMFLSYIAWFTHIRLPSHAHSFTRIIHVRKIDYARIHISVDDLYT